MSRVFAITSATDHISVNPDGKGEVTFTVTNSAARPIRAQIKARPLEETKSEWLSIIGEPERDFTPGVTQQVVVQLPAGTPAGKHFFRIDAISVENPDEDYSEGPVVALKRGLPAPPARPFPWWILIVVSVSLVLVSGLVYLLIPKKGEVPNVVVPVVINKPFKEAEERVIARGLVVDKESKEDPEAKEEMVIDQDPKEGSIKKGGTIKLTVTVPVPPFKMPDFKGAGTSIKEAYEFLRDKYVKLEEKPVENGTEPEGKILDQSPGKDAEVKIGDTITLTFAVAIRPFPMPGVSGKNWADAKRELENKGLKVISTERIDPGRAHESVVDQSPPINTPVKSGDQVTLTVAITLVNVPFQTVGRDWRTAKAILSDSGLALSEVRGDCSRLVEASEPRGGLPVRKGSSVTLYTQGDRNRICHSELLRLHQILSDRASTRISR
jgi:eukaryotic-like serine/threonine-protein kinase